MALPASSPAAHLWPPTRAFLGTLLRYAGVQGRGAVVLVALGAVLDGAGLLLLVPIVETVVNRGGGSARWVVEVFAALGITSPLARLSLLLAAFVAMSFIRAFTLYARDMALGRLQTGFVEEQRNGLMRLIAAAPWSAIVGVRHAHVTSLMTVEVQRVASSTQYVIQSGVAVVMLVVQAAIAIALAPLLAIVAGTLIVVAGLIVFLQQRRIRAIGEGLVGANTALMGSASGFLSGLKAAAAQNAQRAFVAEFETIQAEVRDRQLRFQQRQAASRRSFSLGSGLAGAAVVLIGFAASVPPAILITVVLIFARMSGPTMQIQSSMQNFFFALPSFEAIRVFQAELRAIVPPAQTVEPPAGPIEVQGISYRHPGGGGLAPASFILAVGSFVGIAGPSGAGKTTLVDLLTTLLAPQTGVLLVGGEPLDATRAAGWRERIAYVPQEGFLFHDTVRRNLGWGSAAGTDDAAMWRALTLAGADALVQRMPLGLDTVVGERGALLSGGERQRLAIARALLRDARLLVLDEATNAIDAESEAALLAGLAALSPRPTIVMISHRAETMALCDRVLTVERGVLTG